MEVLEIEEFEKKFGRVGRGARESFANVEFQRIEPEIRQLAESGKKNVVLVERYQKSATTINRLKNMILQKYSNLKAVVTEKEGQTVLVVRVR